MVEIFEINFEGSTVESQRDEVWVQEMYTVLRRVDVVNRRGTNAGGRAAAYSHVTCEEMREDNDRRKA